MPGQGPRHMMMERMYLENDTETQSTMLAKNTNLDYQNSFNISIVLGAVSRTSDAYQPNPAYIELGQTIIWTNNDNFIHTVTQKPVTDDIETFPSKFDSGIFNKGQSFVHSFNEEGRYDYYCTIHPWMSLISSSGAFVEMSLNTLSIASIPLYLSSKSLNTSPLSKNPLLLSGLKKLLNQSYGNKFLLFICNILLI